MPVRHPLTSVRHGLAVRAVHYQLVTPTARRAPRRRGWASDAQHYPPRFEPGACSSD